MVIVDGKTRGGSPKKRTLFDLMICEKRNGIGMIKTKCDNENLTQQMDFQQKMRKAKPVHHYPACCFTK